MDRVGDGGCDGGVVLMLAPVLVLACTNNASRMVAAGFHFSESCTAHDADGYMCTSGTSSSVTTTVHKSTTVQERTEYTRARMVPWYHTRTVAPFHKRSSHQLQNHRDSSISRCPPPAPLPLRPLMNNIKSKTCHGIDSPRYMCTYTF